jgi:hypothetical protein
LYYYFQGAKLILNLREAADNNPANSEAVENHYQKSRHTALSLSQSTPSASTSSTINEQYDAITNYAQSHCDAAR